MIWNRPGTNRKRASMKETSSLFFVTQRRTGPSIFVMPCRYAEGITALAACSRNMQARIAASPGVAQNMLGEGGLQGRLLTKIKAVDLDAKDLFYGRTPLLWVATRLGNENVIKHLIDAGAKHIECQGRWPTRTALLYACEEGNGTVVRLLLKTGLANPNSMSTYGRTSPSFASEKGHTSIVKLLLAVESVTPDLAGTTYGRTPLSWAATSGHMEMVQLLPNTNAVDLWSSDLVYNRTPGMWAAANGHREIAGLLQYKEPNEPGEPSKDSHRSR